MSTADLSPHVMPIYGRLPIAMSHGQGAWVWDTAGRQYLDALSGIAVNTLGHNHPGLVAALQDQLGRLIHCCNYYHVPGQENVAAKLVQLSGLTNAFFCNSGLEANEAAIKIARKYGHDRGVERPAILVFDCAFHGRSIATLTATANPKIRAGFAPLVDGFERAHYNDIDSVRQALSRNPDIVAIFLETIQGEGGIRPANIGFLQQLRALCDERELLLMLDEVQCGMGRTGKWFAFQWADIRPDVMALAKGLASGVPTGAVVAGPRAATVLQAGNHGSTFGGNPLAMRAAQETLRIMEEDGLLEHAAHMGERLHGALHNALRDTAGVRDIRGLGLMTGIELERPCGILLQRAAEAGLLLSVTADTVVRLLPPLIISAVEVDEIVARLVPLIRSFLAESAAA